MKKFKVLTLMAVAVFMALGLVSCGNDDDDAKLEGERIGRSVERALKNVNTKDTLLTISKANGDSLRSESLDDGIAAKIARDTVSGAIEVSVYNYGNDSGIDGDDITGIVAIISVFSVPILCVFFVAFFVYKGVCARNRMIEAAVKAGVSLPANLFNRSTPARRTFKTAMICMAVGAGLAVFFLMAGSPELCGLCAVPFLIGVGLWATYLVEDRRHVSDEDDKTENDSSSDDNASIDNTSNNSNNKSF